MPTTAVANAEAPEPSYPTRPPLKPMLILVAGGLTLFAWFAFLASGFLGVGEEGTRFLSDVLLGAVVLSAVGALWSGKWVYAAISTLMGVVYIAVWYLLGNTMWGLSDAIYFVLIAGFYLSVPISGVSTMLAGRTVLRATR